MIYLLDTVFEPKQFNFKIVNVLGNKVRLYKVIQNLVSLLN